MLFNAANILLVAAIGIAGISVAFPVGIRLALGLGVVVNYRHAPVGNAELLFSGMALTVLAILLNAFANRRSATGNAGLSTKGLLLSVVAALWSIYVWRELRAAPKGVGTCRTLCCSDTSYVVGIDF